MNSEHFVRKLQRAQEALSQSDSSSVKTLSASFGPKWPYKRTMSAPASMVPRQDTKQGTVFIVQTFNHVKRMIMFYSAIFLTKMYN